MDTWATSSLTPQIATFLVDDEERFKTLLPMDLRPQGQDIIRTWLFYTILRSCLEHGVLPWKNTVISGFVLDPDRKKMSKSKGNVVTPMPLLKAHGADALRYWAASGRPGVDTAADEGQIKIGRRMAIKLLNASKFALAIANLPTPENSGLIDSVSLHPLDASMLAHLSDVVDEATKALETYDHTKALEVAEKFFWSFCDDYLELVKLRAYGEVREFGPFKGSFDLSATMSARISLLSATRVLLRLFAPFMPFVSEEVWSWFNDDSLHLQTWPSSEMMGKELVQNADQLFGISEVSEYPADKKILELVAELLAAVRKAKSESKLSMKTRVQHLEIEASPTDLAIVNMGLDDLCDAGGVVALTAVENQNLARFEVKAKLESTGTSA
jgi:valyl-tRNA synthetase